MIMQLMLFGTEGCHLCEQAEEVIAECLTHHPSIAIEFVDIAATGSERWYELYSIRIPVLLHPESQIELSWPFDEADVNHFISKLH